MNPPPSAPVRAERVQIGLESDAELSVSVEGRLQDARRLPSRAILVLDAGGGKHRFTQIAEPRNQAGLRDRRWTARFIVPAELGPTLAHGAAVFIGGVEIPLPPPEDITAEIEVGAEQVTEVLPTEVLPTTSAEAEPAAARSRSEPLGGPTDEEVEGFVSGSRVVGTMQALLDELRELEAELGDWEREAQTVS